MKESRGAFFRDIMPCRERVYSCRLSTSLGPHLLATPYLVLIADGGDEQTKYNARRKTRRNSRRIDGKFPRDAPPTRRRFLRRSVGKYRKIDNRLGRSPVCFAHTFCSFIKRAYVTDVCIRLPSGNEIFSDLSGRWISIRLQIRARARSPPRSVESRFSLSLSFFLLVPRDCPRFINGSAGFSPRTIGLERLDSTGSTERTRSITCEILGFPQTRQQRARVVNHSQTHTHSMHSSKYYLFRVSSHRKIVSHSI